jgi:hypothetical protein
MEYLLITKDTTHFQKRGYGNLIYLMRFVLAYIPCMQAMARVAGPRLVSITGLSSAW